MGNHTHYLLLSSVWYALAVSWAALSVVKDKPWLLIVAGVYALTAMSLSYAAGRSA